MEKAEVEIWKIKDIWDEEITYSVEIKWGRINYVSILMSPYYKRKEDAKRYARRIAKKLNLKITKWIMKGE